MEERQKRGSSMYGPPGFANGYVPPAPLFTMEETTIVEPLHYADDDADGFGRGVVSYVPGSNNVPEGFSRTEATMSVFDPPVERKSILKPRKKTVKKQEEEEGGRVPIDSYYFKENGNNNGVESLYAVTEQRFGHGVDSMYAPTERTNNNVESMYALTERTNNNVESMYAPTERTNNNNVESMYAPTEKTFGGVDSMYAPTEASDFHHQRAGVDSYYPATEADFGGDRESMYYGSVGGARTEATESVYFER
ncbi:hypothetical protein HDV05_001565 [Chytridiales sp. JEL 0842]|nr:hypothetical protein HDV05_001565 [Chytridiales sp. JEL 0842]